jgi:hypothetical protein
MQVIGKGHVHIYDAADEGPHPPNAEALWQESWALFAWDTEQQIFVFLRLGQEPNRGPGYTAAWINLWTPEYIFKHTDDSIPFAPGDRSEKSLSAGNGLCRYEYAGTHNWTVSHEDVQVTLSMQDSHPGFGYWQEGNNALASETGKAHAEASGFASGTVTVAGRAYQFSGTAWRDHSWGKRNWRGIRAHRFYAGMFGTDFSFFGITMVGADGSMARMGTILRGDTIEATSDYDIVAYVGEDGVSNCGGYVTLRLGGTTETLNFEPFGKSVVSVHQDCTISDAMCRVTMGDRVGVGISESSHNAQGGITRPAVFPHSKGVLDNGLQVLTMECAQP